MDQHKLRKEAIKRYLNGDCVTTICRELRVSRKWFYKWRHRYNTGVSDWYKDQSKTPKRKPRKIDNEIENLVLNIRKKLEETKYAQIGAMAIAWRINQLGGTPPPLWTINRILKRKGKIMLFLTLFNQIFRKFSHLVPAKKYSHFIYFFHIF